MNDTRARLRIEPAALRWRCDPSQFAFDTTAELDAVAGVHAQPTALEALEFALASRSSSQNVFVRGARGTGRKTLVRQALAAVDRKPIDKPDRCYVHNFSQPNQPRLVSLPTGHGRIFRKRMRDLAELIARELPKAMESEPLASERLAVQERVRERIGNITEPLEQELRQNGMSLVSVQQGPITQTLIFPLVDGEPVPPGQFRQLAKEKKVKQERLEQFEEKLPEFQKRLQTVAVEVMTAQREAFEEVESLNEKAARDLLAHFMQDIRYQFPQEPVCTFLDEIVDDVIETRLGAQAEQLPDPYERYGVNVVLEHQRGERVPVIEEHVPSLVNLLGTVEWKWGRQGPMFSDYSGVRAGSLLRADGGYLVIDVDDIVGEPGAWRALMRTLRTGRLEIMPPELGWLRPQALINPEPIEVSVRVVLVGDHYAHHLLSALDPDFGELFKVLADFDSEVQRDPTGIQQYAAAVAQIVKDRELRPFDREGVAALVEHSARIAARGRKLTARFGRVSDIAEEASFLAEREGVEAVGGDHVREAVRRTRFRASLPSRRFQDYINEGTIRIQTEGSEIGQINGLAVIQSGAIVYGFPARITSTIGPGQAGLINIEGSAKLSGAIHTKGFYILGGLLRYLLKATHPLAFSASIAFEQSYGGIDGDSASGAEICCLLSALTGIPLDQGIAMTGSIDQHGRIQAVGGVTEKVEGYYDVCAHFGLNGRQGVIVPKSNAGDLMLRHDVVEACEAGRFQVYAVDRVHDAIEILTGLPAGEWIDGAYPGESVLGRAVKEAGEYWRKSVQSPRLMRKAAAGEAPAVEPGRPSLPGDLPPTGGGV